VGQIANLPHSWQVASLSRVANTTSLRRPMRWAWPAAFSVMTGIAALLLVALALRPVPQVVERIVERVVSVPAKPQQAATQSTAGRVAPGTAVDFPEMTVPGLPDWMAWGFSSLPSVNTNQQSSYAKLRNQVLLHGLERWKPAASESDATSPLHEEPVLGREQLNHWLDQEGVESGLQRNSTPSLRNSSGAKS
jgi:hypothetical protein